ncbi:hypothetical protein SAMN04488063_2072 [Halopelagius inordinatus]|uniref:Uncharacterized protein n=1 Tax=Halopelagius inordinatus TaxID=553467 RepID=A0A1I2S3L6_9EURY|nr:hypothetical protein [Halopelagius inordinatus]SFG44571.1 hypothetical protein SAMN04488063_2072 [Halopelagius inordinatus]
MTQKPNSTDRPTSRRSVLRTSAAAGGLLLWGTAATGTAAARGQNKRTVLKPDYSGNLSGAAGTREEANTLSGSWQVPSDTTGDGDSDKFQLYLSPDDLFVNAGDVTVDDLTHVSYHTKKDAETSGTVPYNVYLQMYTEPDGADDQASWYGYRLTAEPYFSQNLDAPGGEWIRWSTESGDNRLTFFDDSKVGFGFYGGQPTLEELQAGPIDWSSRKSGAPSTDVDYGQEVIKYVTLQTGSGYPASFDAFVDTVEIGISNGAGKGKGNETGQTARIDLEP